MCDPPPKIIDSKRRNQSCFQDWNVLMNQPVIITPIKIKYGERQKKVASV